MISFLLLIAHFIIAIQGACELQLFKSCECGVIDYMNKPQYVLKCADTGFTDVAVLSHLPEKTEVLIFTGNSIPSLPWNIFGSTKNFTNLRVIDLSNNGIKLIHGKTFHHVSNVETLILNHNEISISSNSNGLNARHPRVFSNFENLRELHMTNAFMDSAEGLAEDLHEIFINSELKQLRKIHLEQNEIERFKDPKIFCELPSIMDLYLANNKIKSIDFDIECLQKLRFIDLENNAISAVTASDMAKMDTLIHRGQKLTIDIGENPLACGDQLSAFYSWLECSKVQVRNKGKLKCKDHSGNKTCSIVVTPASCDVHHGPLYVRGTLPKKHATSHLMPILVTLALAISLSLNLAFFYAKLLPHDPIGTWFSGLSRKLTTSVHYTKQSNLDDI